MYKWKIEIVLRNGKEVECLYKSDYDNSGDVAKNCFPGGGNDFVGFLSMDKRKNIFVRIGDISSFAISLVESGSGHEDI